MAALTAHGIKTAIVASVAGSRLLIAVAILGRGLVDIVPPLERPRSPVASCEKRTRLVRLPPLTALQRTPTLAVRP